MAKAVRARNRLRRLGNRLWAVFDVAEMRPCQERVDGNEATALVSTWIWQTVAMLPAERRPTGFFGVAGESRFRATIFPDSLLSELRDKVRSLVEALAAAPTSGPISISGPDYRIVLNLMTDADSVRQWIEETNRVSAEEQPPRPLRKETPPELSSDYVAAYAELRDYLNDARSQVAARLQPLLQTQAEAMPSEKYADKQRLSMWVNAQMRELGLAIRCPSTGRPAILVADVRDAESGSSRFRFQIRDENGRQRRTISSVTLPNLELIPDEMRVEGRARGPAAGGTSTS